MGTPIANGGAPATPPADDHETIANDGFWPDVDLKTLRAATRLTGNVTVERLRASVIAAMLDINHQLATYRARQIGQGWDSAADIGDTLGGHSSTVQHYLRAVACTVQADFAESYRDWDSTSEASLRGRIEASTADDLRRTAQWAVSAILGRARSSVELI